MIKMIKYNFKKRYLFIITTTIVLLALSLEFIHNRLFVGAIYEPHSFDLVDGPLNPPLGFVATMGCILSIIIPIVEFKFKMKKISIDQMYSMPIKREKLYLSNFLFGFIEILIPITVLFIDLIITILLSNHMYELKYLFIYYICLIGLVFILYSTVSFFFTRGNTLFDGIMNIIFISLIFALFINSINSFYRSSFIGDWERYRSFTIFSPIINVTNYYMDKTCEKSMLEINPNYLVDTFDLNKIISLILIVFVGIVSFILFIILNKNDKAENSMDISNSWFSYKVFIPAYVLLFSISSANTNDLLSFIAVNVVGYIGYATYRRGLKLKKIDYILLFSLSLIPFLIL